MTAQSIACDVGRCEPVTAWPNPAAVAVAVVLLVLVWRWCRD